MNIISSKLVVSKIIAMWLPIFLFVALGFEHSVVNMFVLYTNLIWQGKNSHYTTGDWFAYNQIPTVIGNVFGGFMLTTFVYHKIYKVKQSKN